MFPTLTAMPARLAATALAIAVTLLAGCSAPRVVEEEIGDRDVTVVRLATQTEPAPTLVALHGGGGSGDRVRRYSRLDSLVRAHGIVVAYPEATGGHWNDGRPIDLVAGIDDTGFLVGLIDDLIDSGLTDPDRVFVLGASNGGMMTLRLMCEHPDRFAGAAVVIANEPAEPTYPCAAEPVPVLFIHGTDDPLMPFAGGRVAPDAREDHGLVESAEATVQRWVTTNECSPATEDTLGDDGTVTAVRTEYACDGAPLRWIVLIGGGHDWPGADQSAAREALLGSSGPVDATALIWEFFEALP